MLPQEIILNILTRLPPKSVAQFRCVSKLWKSLLSHPHFIKSHLNQIHHSSTQEQISLFLIPKGSNNLYSIKLTNNPLNHSTHIPSFPKELIFNGHQFSARRVNVDTMASCDGLILVKNEENKLLLVNPTTKEVHVLPTSPFALDPSISYTIEGFGYDHINDDYKVVTLSYYDAYYYEGYDENDPNCTGIFINVYSVKKGTWKRCGKSPYDHAVGYPTSGVCINGKIHFLASNSVYKSVIGAFDLGEEKFNYEAPPPNSVDVKKFVFNRLVNLGGCLCMFCDAIIGGGTKVWIMKEYGVRESWIEFMVNDDEKSEFRPVCMVGKENVVMLKDMDPDFYAKKMVMYNMEDGSLRDVEIDGVFDEFCVGGVFKETLVSPRIADP